MNAALALSSGRAREFGFEPADHRAVAKLVYDEVGILLPEGKAQLVYGRLAPRVRACGLDSVGAYVALIQRDEQERGRAIDALTTNHTSFFRESHHFDDFNDRLWPGLSERLARGGRVRLWSAACSMSGLMVRVASAWTPGPCPSSKRVTTVDRIDLSLPWQRPPGVPAGVVFCAVRCAAVSAAGKGSGSGADAGRAVLARQAGAGRGADVAQPCLDDLVDQYVELVADPQMARHRDVGRPRLARRRAELLEVLEVVIERLRHPVGDGEDVRMTSPADPKPEHGACTTIGRREVLTKERHVVG